MFLTKKCQWWENPTSQKMPNYQRARGGNTYFFTVVTYQRRPFLCLEESRSVLREVIGMVRGAHPFSIEARLLLPDHMHCVWRLLDGDTDYSLQWALIKKEFSKRAKGWLNPVKHGLANAPKDWPCSTFHRYDKKGIVSKGLGSDANRVRPGCWSGGMNGNGIWWAKPTLRRIPVLVAVQAGLRYETQHLWTL